MKKIRKVYDWVFKEKAVQLSYERHNISELARELGITAPQLYKWRKEYEEFGQGSFPGNGNLKQTPEQERIAKLERKLNDAEIERDILKKAIGIFSKNGRWFIFLSETMKRYFRLKRCIKFYKLVKEVITNGKAVLFQTENKELSLLRKK
jgi:transposase